MITTTTAEDRIAALRDEYARQGEDVTSLSDTELLYRELDRSRAESRRHENAYSSLLQDQVKHDRAVYTAAQRGAVERQNARGGMYLEVIVRRSALPITGLIYRISQLPDRPSPKVVEELKAAARSAQWTLDGVVSSKVLGEIADQDPGVKLTEAQAAEIARLREFIAGLGRKLHAKHGGRGARESGWRCECSGCELIRAMDDPADIEQAA